MFYCPIDLKPNPKPTKQYLRYAATKLFEAGLEFEADFSKIFLLDIEFSEEKCLESYPRFNLSWLFSCLPCLKSFPCSESVQCIFKIPQVVCINKVVYWVLDRGLATLKRWTFCWAHQILLYLGYSTISSRCEKAGSY